MLDDNCILTKQVTYPLLDTCELDTDKTSWAIKIRVSVSLDQPRKIDVCTLFIPLHVTVSTLNNHSSPPMNNKILINFK